MWLRDNGVLLLTIGIVGWLGYAIYRGILVASQRGEPTAEEDHARARRVKQEVRAKIADRKVNPLPAVPPKLDPGRSGRAGPLRPIDPFGGGRGRGWWSRLRDWTRRKR
jgi:hypothetical protein